MDMDATAFSSTEMIIWWFFLGLILLSLWYKLTLAILGCVWVRSLQKKAVLISGCDSGFGQKAALEFIKYGIPVIAGCLTEQGETELIKRTNNSSLLHAISLNIANDDR